MVPEMWRTLISEEPTGSERSKAVHHLLCATDLLSDSDYPYDAGLDLIVTCLLMGEGALAPFWSDFPPGLRTAMQVAGMDLYFDDTDEMVARIAAAKLMHEALDLLSGVGPARSGRPQ